MTRSKLERLLYEYIGIEMDKPFGVEIQGIKYICTVNEKQEMITKDGLNLYFFYDLLFGHTVAYEILEDEKFGDQIKPRLMETKSDKYHPLNPNTSIIYEIHFCDPPDKTIFTSYKTQDRPKRFFGTIENFAPMGKCVFWNIEDEEILVIDYSYILAIMPTKRVLKKECD